MAIYLKIDKPNTIQELLLQLFSCYGYYNTGAETYFDEACTQIQCESNKWRTFGDIFEIVNTYFPNTEEKEIMHELLILPLKNNAGSDLYPHLVFCNKINMCTLMQYPGLTSCDTSFTQTKGIGKYAWGELLGLLGITNYEELKNYIEQNKTKIKNEETIATAV